MPVIIASLCFAFLRIHSLPKIPARTLPARLFPGDRHVNNSFRPTTTSIYNDNIGSLPLHAIMGGGRAVGLTYPIML